MTADAAAVLGLVINATPEYLTNNYRILKRHLKFMVDPPGSKHTHTARSKKKRDRSLVLRVFLLPVQLIETRFARKTADIVWRGIIAWSTLSKIKTQQVNRVITSDFVHCRPRPTVTSPLTEWSGFLARKFIFSHKVCYMLNSVLACVPVSYQGQKMLG